VLIRQNLLRLLQHFAVACLILSVQAETDITPIGLSSNEQAWLREYPVMLGAKPDMSINRFQDLATALTATSLGVTDVTGSALDAMAFTRRRYQGILWNCIQVDWISVTLQPVEHL
jgi:hypothetical protein